MLVCKNCGYVACGDSEYWDVEEDYNTDMDGRPVAKNTSIYCPECGSDEIEEAQECEHCHEYFDPDTLVIATVEHPEDDTEETFEVCPDCYDDYYFKAPGVKEDSNDIQ